MEVFTIVIATVAVLATLVSTIIQKKLTDVDLVKSLKSEIKKINKEMKESKQDTNKINKLMSKSFELQKKMMGQTMKPTMVSSIVVFVAFFFVSAFFSHVFLSLPFSLPFLGNKLSWFWIFVIASVVSSLIFRKIFDLGW